MKKVTGVIIRVILTSLVCLLSLYVLNKFEFLKSFNDIDNIVGVIPFAIVIIVSTVMIAFLWMKHTKQRLPLSITLLAVIALSIILFPNALKGNWWIDASASNVEESKPDLTVYEPFLKNSKTAKLDEKSDLKLLDSLPVLEGATALYPLYAAFAETVYDETNYSNEKVLCTNTRGAYEKIVSKERDIIFVAGASDQQLTFAKEAGVELEFTPIGREAFVFLVGKQNPIDNITYQQIRNIYSGKTNNWKTLGWREGGKIIAFQRPEGSGSQTGLQSIMDEFPVQVPQPLPDKKLLGTNSLLRQVSVEWKGVQPAIGYSYRYYATTMYPNLNSKLVSIDGISPSTENIQNGNYPFVADFYAVTNGKPKGNSKKMIDWILSPQGQELVEKTGYTPLNNNAK